GGAAARYRPGGAGAGALGVTGRPPADSNCRTVYVPNLHRVFPDGSGLPADRPAVDGGEFVLLRTRTADCISQSRADSGDRFDERLNLHDLVPVDQFDFTGVERPGYKEVPPDSENWIPVFYGVHYVRANDPAATPSGAWRFVYPGRYDGARQSQRHQGMVQVTFAPSGADDPSGVVKEEDVSAYDPPVRLGLPDAAAHANQGSFPIQLGPVEDWPGPNRPQTGTPANHPFGLFAREGDILQVPFIGAYTIFADPAPPPPSGFGGELFEMNSVTIDSAFAEDTDVRDDWPGRPGELYEQVGRFCPVQVTYPPPDPADPLIRIDDFFAGQFGDSGDYPPGGTYDVDPPNPAFYRYRWARDLFDYFTVEAPHDDYLPNVPPDLYRTPSGLPADPPPQAVSNSGGTANDLAEKPHPVEGRININTAPWKVLASLPLVLDPATGRVDVARTEELAKTIVYFRDVNGAAPGWPVGSGFAPQQVFGSVMDLNDVVDLRPPELRREDLFPSAPGRIYSFRNGYGSFDPSGHDGGPGPATPAGDLSPYRPGDATTTDGVRGDFEEQFLTLTRISNLVTTRSDSFTCYIYVVGVQYAGTPDARIKVQRRVGLIIDRSTVTPDRPTAHVQRFSQE
ncbi:MAG TPA: hypothetical protein VFB66_25850, partial [Tepidisphaeraceae bacterium]|nr:hypothetical protein [Tepidisphaeraceae bacterium]